MGDSADQKHKLDPKLRERLLNESRNPFRGIRRGLWIALFGSACVGSFVMSLRAISGQGVLISDGLIQFSALLIFGGLLWFDSGRGEEGGRR